MGSFCSKFKCVRTQGNVLVGHFSGHVVLDHSLDVEPAEIFDASKETLCVKRCVKFDPCRTVGVVPANGKKVTCLLFKENIYSNRSKLVKKAGSKLICLGVSI